MKRYLSLAVSILLALGVQAAQKEVEILTESEDYGLELEWAHGMTCGGAYIQIRDGVSDTLGNTYICGCYQHYLHFPNGEMIEAPDYYNAGYVAKYDRKGDLLWTFNFEGSCVCSMNNIWLMPTGDILLFGKVSINQYHDTAAIARFNGDEKIRCTFGYDCGKDCEKNNHEMLIKINPENGEYIDHVLVDTRETKVFDIAPTGDIYLYSYIDERFKGLDTLRLKSETRTHGDWDAYLAKITPDFQLAWDYAIGGERADVPWVPVTAEYYREYYGYSFPYNESMVNWFAVVDDTLYLKAAIFSKGVDIDMDSQKEVLLSPTECEHDAVVAKYLLKEDGYPELLDYVYDYSLWLPHYFAKAENGHLMAYDQDEDNRLLLHYKEFGQDFRSKERKGYPFETTNIFTFGKKYKVNFDRKGNIILNMESGYRCDPLDEQLSDNVHLYSDPDEDATAVIVKYDKGENFRWAVLWPYISWADVYVTDDQGGLYIGGTNTARTTQAWTDLDPEPDKEVTFKTEPGVYVKYIETFRVKAEASENGEIIVPNKRVRWGEDCIVEVMPKKGFKVEEVKTLSGELLEKNADGTFTLKRVTDTVTVRASFVEVSDVEDFEDRLFVISTIATNDILHIDKGAEAEKIEIIDIEGKIHREKPSEDIDLSNYADGAYTLRLKYRNSIINKKFIKK